MKYIAWMMSLILAGVSICCGGQAGCPAGDMQKEILSSWKPLQEDISLSIEAKPVLHEELDYMLSVSFTGTPKDVDFSKFPLRHTALDGKNIGLRLYLNGGCVDFAPGKFKIKALYIENSSDRPVKITEAAAENLEFLAVFTPKQSNVILPDMPKLNNFSLAVSSPSMIDLSIARKMKNLCYLGLSGASTVANAGDLPPAMLVISLSNISNGAFVREIAAVEKLYFNQMDVDLQWLEPIRNLKYVLLRFCRSRNFDWAEQRNIELKIISQCASAGI